jgi:hypothetical protein
MGFSQAQNATFMYLQQYFTDKYATILNQGMLIAVNSALVSIDNVKKEGTSDLSLVFSAGTSPVPTTADVDNLLSLAFEDPAVKGLFTALQGIATVNPKNQFITTTMVAYRPAKRRRLILRQ